MAREESDREDLLREATALVERIELLPTRAEPCATDASSRPSTDNRDSVVVGFRPNGAISFFFGADPVYHFNTDGKLRRAYSGGLLFKAIGGQLIALERFRTSSQVELRRRELSKAEQQNFLTHLHGRLQHLAARLATSHVTIVGQVPTESAVLERVKNWLTDHEHITVAETPNV